MSGGEANKCMCCEERFCVECQWYKELQHLKHYTKEDLAPTAQRLQKENELLKNFLMWILKQQYYIIHNNLKKKIKDTINGIKQIIQKVKENEQ